MKISKKSFIRVLSKHFVKTLGIPENIFNPTEAISAVTPVFNTFVPSLKKEKIMTKDNRIDIDALENWLNQFFAMFPVFRIPAKKFSITITESMAKEFLADLKKNCDVDSEEVICLPCH